MQNGDIVIFTGWQETFWVYDEPTNLVVDKIYEIESIKVYAWRTDVKLKGVQGTFSSTWFAPASPRRRFKYSVLKDGSATFVFSGDSIFNSEDESLGTFKDLCMFAYHNRFTIDFSKMVVRKA